MSKFSKRQREMLDDLELSDRLYRERAAEQDDELTDLGHFILGNAPWNKTAKRRSASPVRGERD